MCFSLRIQNLKNLGINFEYAQYKRVNAIEIVLSLSNHSQKSFHLRDFRVALYSRSS